MKKTLTIFTPAYNRAPTLSRTYESLLRQTCNDFEWLIVDDGSKDSTKSLVEGWIQEGKSVSGTFTSKIRECTVPTTPHTGI